MTTKHSVLSESFENTIAGIKAVAAESMEKLQDIAKVAGIRNGLDKTVTFDSVENEINTALSAVKERMDKIADLAKTKSAEIGSPEFKQRLIMEGLLKYSTISEHQTKQEFDGKTYDREKLGTSLTQLKNLNQAFEGVGESIMKDFGLKSDPSMVVEKVATKAFIEDIQKRHGVSESRATYVPKQEPGKDRTLGM